MTLEQTLPPELAGPLEAVTDADRAWFEAHPRRRYHLRPTRLSELMPGQTMRLGAHTVVIRCGSPDIRFRLDVGCPPLRLRQDTDRCCAEIVKVMERAGYELDGRPIGEALARFRAGAERLIREARARDAPAASAPTGAGERP